MIKPKSISSDAAVGTTILAFSKDTSYVIVTLTFYFLK